MDLFDHYFQIILLGIVEGVTEFLPISSTGHLLIAEAFLGVREPDVFNVVIQAGAILAVVFIYWHKIADLFGSLDKSESRAYVLKIFLAFVVTGVIGIILTHHFHLKLPETLAPVAWATLIGGLVIFAVEYVAKNLYPHDDVSWPEAVLIGLGQILAGIFPGTSRSGATIMTAMAFGMKRTAATQFSFLLGIPTMFAASALDLVKYRKDLTSGGHQLLIDIALGFVVSAIVAFFVVKWLLRFVQSHTFNGFAIYRVLLGAGLLIAIAVHPSLAKIGEDENPKQKASVRIKDEPTLTAPTPATNTEVTPPAPAPDAAPAVAPSNVSPAMEPAPTPTTDAAPLTPAAPSTPADASNPAPAVMTPAPDSAPTPAPANVPAPQN